MPREQKGIEPQQRTWAVLELVQQEFETCEEEEPLATTFVALASSWGQRLLVVQEHLLVELDWSFLGPWCCRHPSIPCHLHA